MLHSYYIMLLMHKSVVFPQIITFLYKMREFVYQRKQFSEKTQSV